MITNAADLNVALTQLSQFADTLEGMRMHAEKINSRAFPTLSQVYIHRIREINAEIRDYLNSQTQEAGDAIEPVLPRNTQQV